MPKRNFQLLPAPYNRLAFTWIRRGRPGLALIGLGVAIIAMLAALCLICGVAGLPAAGLFLSWFVRAMPLCFAAMFIGMFIARSELVLDTQEFPEWTFWEHSELGELSPAQQDRYLVERGTIIGLTNHMTLIFERRTKQGRSFRATVRVRFLVSEIRLTEAREFMEWYDGLSVNRQKFDNHDADYFKEEVACEFRRRAHVFEATVEEELALLTEAATS